MAQKVPLSAVARQLNVLADHLLSLEANQAPPESVAAACSGAGRPNLSEEPRPVLGPGSILAKMETFIEEELESWRDPDDTYFVAVVPKVVAKKAAQHLSKLLGAEAQASSQDAK